MHRAGVCYACVTLLLAVALACGIVGAKETITIMVHWGAGSPPYDSLMQYVREYMQLYPSVQVDLIGTGGGDSGMWERFNVMTAGGTPPDSVHVATDSIGESRSRFRPVPASTVSLMKKEYLPAAIELATCKGEVWGFPTEFQIPATVYNKQVFAEAGIGHPPTPGTWESYINLARRLTRRGADEKVERYGAVAGGWRTIYDVRSYVNSHGYEIVTPDGKAQLNSPFVINAVELWHGLVNEGTMIYSGATAFSKGTAAVTTWEPWLRNNLRRDRLDLYESGAFAVSPLPHGTLGKPYVMAYGYHWSITTEARNPQRTLSFLEWLNMAKTDRGTTRMGDVMATLGSLPDTHADLRNQPAMKEAFLKGFIDALPSYVQVVLPDLPGVDSWQGAMDAALKSVFTDKATVPAALEEANTRYSNRMEEASRRTRGES